jgi:hypothetical protein
MKQISHQEIQRYSQKALTYYESSPPPSFVNALAISTSFKKSACILAAVEVDGEGPSFEGGVMTSLVNGEVMVSDFATDEACSSLSSCTTSAVCSG